MAPYDVVNVFWSEDAVGVPRLRRGLRLERTGDGFLAKLDGDDTRRRFEYSQIRQRICLPWKPSDLRDYLISVGGMPQQMSTSRICARVERLYRT